MGAGCGDFSLASVSMLPDPCPLPEQTKKRRSLNEKEKMIYAPMAGVGGIVYDKVYTAQCVLQSMVGPPPWWAPVRELLSHIQDAVYIELAGSHGNERKEGAAHQLVTSLISARHPLDLKMKHAEMALTEGGVPLLGGEGVDGEHVRRVVPEEGGVSGEEGDIETQSDNDREVEEERSVESSSEEESGKTQPYWT